MKVHAYLFFLGIIIVFLFQSCTIEKRRYMNGYHVNWVGKNKAKEKHITGLSQETKASLDVPSIAKKDESNEPAANQPANEMVSALPETKPLMNKPPKQRKSLNERMARQLKLSYLPVSWSVSKAAKENRRLQDYHPVGMGFGLVALILSILTIVAFALALIFAEGWAALGWIAIAVVFAVATLLFATIAQTIFWSKGQGIPAFMILPLIVSVFAVYVSLRLVFDRIFRNG
jgi:hypothetical protein